MSDARYGGEKKGEMITIFPGRDRNSQTRTLELWDASIAFFYFDGKTKLSRNASATVGNRKRISSSEITLYFLGKSKRDSSDLQLLGAAEERIYMPYADT